MDSDLFIDKLVTKSLEILPDMANGERFFEGYLTIEMKDKQGEITLVDELYKVLPIWVDRGAPITDTHSNRVIGKGINFARAVYKDGDGTEYPAIKITGKIHKNYELDDDIWNKIKSGEYKGLSFGGATKSDRKPRVMKDGSVAYELKNLEHYEVAVCKDPAVPLALITDFNPLAKAAIPNAKHRGDGSMVIQCDKFKCYVVKSEIEDIEKTKGDFCPSCGQKTPKKSPKQQTLSILEQEEAKNISIEEEDESDNVKSKAENVNKITPISEAGHTAMMNDRGAHYGEGKRQAKQKPFCPSCGRDHVKEDKKVVQNYRDTHGGNQPTTMVMSTGAPDYKPTCPSGNCPSHGKHKSEGVDEPEYHDESIIPVEKNHAHKCGNENEICPNCDTVKKNHTHKCGNENEICPNCDINKKKVDFSNADLTTAQYTQDVDGGGMGKDGKPKKDETYIKVASTATSGTGGGIRGIPNEAYNQTAANDQTVQNTELEDSGDKIEEDDTIEEDDNSDNKMVARVSQEMKPEKGLDIGQTDRRHVTQSNYETEDGNIKLGGQGVPKELEDEKKVKLQ